MFAYCLIAGVPQRKRGEIWRLLVSQHQQQHPEVMERLSVHPDINTSYEQLLRQLTLHQHAILIDLGEFLLQGSVSVNYG